MCTSTKIGILESGKESGDYQMKIAFLSVLSLVFALVQCQEYIDYNQKAPRGKVKRDNR